MLLKHLDEIKNFAFCKKTFKLIESLNPSWFEVKGILSNLFESDYARKMFERLLGIDMDFGANLCYGSIQNAIELILSSNVLKEEDYNFYISFVKINHSTTCIIYATHFRWEDEFLFLFDPFHGASVDNFSVLQITEKNTEIEIVKDKNLNPSNLAKQVFHSASLNDLTLNLEFAIHDQEEAENEKEDVHYSWADWNSDELV